jgi:hypothetical protein
MIRKILGWFGYGVRYRDHQGLHTYRYDTTDFAMARPIHDKMSVAMPSAKREIYRLDR